MVQWDGMDSGDCVGGGTLGIIPSHPIPSQMVQWDGMDSGDCVGGGTLGIIPSHPRWYNGTGWTVETVLGVVHLG